MGGVRISSHQMYEYGKRGLWMDGKSVHYEEGTTGLLAMTSREEAREPKHASNGRAASAEAGDTRQLCVTTKQRLCEQWQSSTRQIGK